jgi:hypothetical protein
MQFYYRLIVHQRPLNYNRCKLYKILMILDGVLNDNEIARNLNHDQSISRKYIYTVFSIVKIFLVFI